MTVRQSGSGKLPKQATLEPVGERDEQGAQDGTALELGTALGFLFRRLSSRADAAFQAAVGTNDLTPMQMGVLMTVDRLSHLSLRDLARRMQADRSTIQELVKRMVDRGLLARRVSDEDRRVHELWLTDAGRDMLQVHRHLVEQVQREQLSPLSKKEAETLLDLLGRMLRQ